jgi:site-specific recombinase XerD
MRPTDFALRLSAFLTQYLPAQRDLSPNTIKGYRDAFVLLLRYCREVRRIPVERLTLERIDADLLGDFLDSIERERGCSGRTRNHRLSALHSFFRYVQIEQPERILQCQRILAIPLRRIPCGDPTYLPVEGLAAILQQPALATRQGRRDAVLLSVLYDTGARVQELIDLSVRDVRLSTPAQVRLLGKGRKVRIVPLMPSTTQLLRDHLHECGLDRPERAEAPLFVNRRGGRLTRWGIRYLLAKYTERARSTDPSLPRRVTPHTLRHTKAMHLLQCGNPPVVIRDILGHADIQSTQIYAKADLDMKRRALQKAADVAPALELPAWREEGELLTWLRSL